MYVEYMCLYSMHRIYVCVECVCVCLHVSHVCRISLVLPVLSLGSR